MCSFIGLLKRNEKYPPPISLGWLYRRGISFMKGIIMNDPTSFCCLGICQITLS